MNDTPNKPIHPNSLKKYFLNSKTMEQLILMFALLQLTGETLGNSHLMHIKPIPVILMILMSCFSLVTDANITRGLVLGLVGDLCLMFPTTLLFQIGAVFFLIGHLCYIRAFTKDYQSSSDSFKFQSVTLHLATTSIFTILIINSFLLWNYLPIKALFVLYGIVLSSMTITSFYRVQQKRVSHYWIGIAGAIAFMVSDYLIAYSKFMGYKNTMNGALIMLLYYIGQFMILKGNSSHQQKLEQ